MLKRFLYAWGNFVFAWKMYPKVKDFKVGIIEDYELAISGESDGFHFHK